MTNLQTYICIHIAFIIPMYYLSRYYDKITYPKSSNTWDDVIGNITFSILSSWLGMIVISLVMLFRKVRKILPSKPPKWL